METEISEYVKALDKKYTLNLESLRPIPVCEKGVTYDNSDSCIMVVTDEEFAEERLRQAQKHIRDFGELPDKGQFPFTKYVSKENKVVFTGEYFVPDLERYMKKEKIQR